MFSWLPRRRYLCPNVTPKTYHQHRATRSIDNMFSGLHSTISTSPPSNILCIIVSIITYHHRRAYSNGGLIANAVTMHSYNRLQCCVLSKQFRLYKSFVEDRTKWSTTDLGCSVRWVPNRRCCFCKIALTIRLAFCLMSPRARVVDRRWSPFSIQPTGTYIFVSKMWRVTDVLYVTASRYVDTTKTV